MSKPAHRPIKFDPEWQTSQDGVIDLLVAYTNVWAGQKLFAHLRREEFFALPTPVLDRYYANLSTFANTVEHATEADLAQWAELKVHLFGPDPGTVEAQSA